MQRIFLSCLILLVSAWAVAQEGVVNASATGAPAGTPSPNAAVAGKPVSGEDVSASEMVADEEMLTDEPKVPVYLVVRIKLTGTDLTQVAFLNHPEMSTMESCEVERNNGLMAAGWQKLNRSFLNSLRGDAYTADYRCVQSDQHLTPWRYGSKVSHFYHVTTSDVQLKIKEFDNFFACRRALSRSESIDEFCARSPQRIIVVPVEAMSVEKRETE